MVVFSALLLSEVCYIIIVYRYIQNKNCLLVNYTYYLGNKHNARQQLKNQLNVQYTQLQANDHCHLYYITN